MKSTETTETSITLSYRQDKWGIERIVLDTVQNHLPRDSKAQDVHVRLKQNGSFRDLKDADPEEETEEIVFQDDGEGFDSNLLSTLYSTKRADQISSGQFGEGLKLVSAAALRNNIDVQYSSRDWSAVPFSKQRTIDGEEVRKLCFRVHKLHNQRRKGSETRFENPPEELVDEVLSLPEKVLYFNDAVRVLGEEENNEQTTRSWRSENESEQEFRITALSGNRGGNLDEATDREPGVEDWYNSRIIDLNNGGSSLFVKGIKVKELEAIFSYDLATDEITPDRQYAPATEVEHEIGRLLKHHAEKDAVKQVLVEAEKQSRKYLEFRALSGRNKSSFERGAGLSVGSSLGPSRNKINSTWRTAFYDTFGENAVLSSRSEADKDAEHLEYNVVSLDRSVDAYVRRIQGINTAKDVVGEKRYVWVEKDELTEQERSVLNLSDRINEKLRHIIERNYEGSKRRDYDSDFTHPELYVFEKAVNKAGREIPTAGMTQIDERMGIRRDQLQDPLRFTETYVHEIGHQVSKSPDYDRNFEQVGYDIAASLLLELLDE